VLITSRGNSTIKQIRRLRDRRERERTGLFFVEGIRATVEAATEETRVQTCVWSPELLRSEVGRETVTKLEAAGVEVLTVSPAVFESLAAKEGPQGIGAVVRQRWTDLNAAHPDAGLCWVALQAVQDPGNLGTIMRTCDAVGAAGVLLLGSSSDPYDPAAVRASMGAIFTVHLVRTTEALLVDWCRRHGCCLVGTSDAAATDYTALRYRRPLMLLMGSEREGLSREQQSQCDAVVRIPMVGRSDSLNVAVATSIMLYEIFNQSRRQANH
jgi:TrmH family RNA methyltransferase